MNFLFFFRNFLLCFYLFPFKNLYRKTGTINDAPKCYVEHFTKDWAITSHVIDTL